MAMQGTSTTVPERKLIAGRRLRWDEARAAQAYAQGLWVRSTLADALRQTAQQSPQRVLLVDGATRLDAQSLLQQAERLAQALLARAAPGAVVSFMLPNWHEAAVIYLGATLAGMVANPILPSLRERELRFILQDCDSRFLFIPARFREHDYAAMLSQVCATLPQPPAVVVLRGEAGKHLHYESLLREPARALPLPAQEADALRMVMYTSGTTGRAKGVMHSHNSIHALNCQLRAHWRITPGDKFLVPSPISHIGGSIYAFEGPLLLGTTAVLMARWEPDAAVALMQAEGCTHMAGATPFLQQLLAAAQRAGTRLPQLKVFICGGASVPPALIREAGEYFSSAAVTRVYGSTEVPVTTVGVTDRADAAHAASSDGLPGIAQIRLAAVPGASEGDGEILARGPQMLRGYLHEEDDASAFDGEGYFRTGDLGRWQDDRYLVVTGRAKDLIIRNGENISPKEVEDLLLTHPQIAEVAIVGLPDPRTGERACAVVVPRGAEPPSLDALREFLLRLQVARFKLPEQLQLRAALPKNDAGKVLKQQLRSELM